MGICIPKSEFQERIIRIQAEMEREKLDAVAVYGDEYRKENLRYVCNFWPIFERGICVIPKCGEPTLAGAPEGESYAKEMSVWKDYRNVKEFACVSVPEEIDYPLATFSSLKEILQGALKGGKRLGLVGVCSSRFRGIPCVFARKGDPRARYPRRDDEDDKRRAAPSRHEMGAWTDKH